MVVFPGGSGGRDVKSLDKLLGAVAGCELTSCCDRALAAVIAVAAPQSINIAEIPFISAPPFLPQILHNLVNLDGPSSFPVASLIHFKGNGGEQLASNQACHHERSQAARGLFPQQV